jgi:hypothetical protein
MVRFAEGASTETQREEIRRTTSDVARRRTPAELQQLGDEIAEFAAYSDAAIYQVLVRLREFDRDEGWQGGFVTCSHWLSWRTGIDRGAAREKVRVARALEHLPRISEALRTVRLSYSKVRALTRIATPETEDRLLELALRATAAQVESLVRAWRKVDRQEEAREKRAQHASRYLTLRPDGDGMYELRGRLAPDVAMVLKRALEAASWELYRSQEAASSTTAPQRRADAIGLVAECALGGEAIGGESQASDADVDVTDVNAMIADAETVRAGDSPEREVPSRPATSPADHRLVVIHVDEGALGAEASAGDALLEDGTRVSAGTSRRFACDASRVVMTHGPDGSVLDVGRRTRSVPPRMRRALDHRDGGCRFPGCGSRFCDAHHVRHWADGGETALDNLVLLCRIHHRAVHEEGFDVEMVAGVPRFRRPDGKPLPDVPDGPAIDGDAIEALRRRHDESGARFAPPAISSGTGERLDLHWAIAALWLPGSSKWVAGIGG